MSKPDSASGSLENILASIRKSLSEQSTDALSEETTASAEPAKDTKSRKAGLTERLAGAGEEGSAAGVQPAGDDLSDLLEEQQAPAQAKPPVAEPSQAAAPVATPPQEDPLWFLTKKEDPVATEAEALPARTAPQEVSAKPAAEPILTRPEVVRASMPPFFGSTAEVAKTEPAPPPEPKAAAAVSPPLLPPVRSGGNQASAAAAAGASSPQQTGGNSRHNGKADTNRPAETKTAPDGDMPHTRGLEAAVLDLLKPMLSRWLEQNMPRLVAEALKEEAARARVSESDAKKG
jgi:cell pole-organizing protein PopZ